MKNAVNRAFMAKKKYIVLGLLMTFALSVSARYFDGTEVIYIQQHPSYWKWYGNDPAAGKFAFFKNSSTHAETWSTEAIGVDYCDDLLQILVPKGNWDVIILTRNSVHSNPNWDNVFDHGTGESNQSVDITIHATQNYLQNFRQLKDQTSDNWLWSEYFTKPSGNPTTASSINGVAKELISVCDSAVGDPFSLQPTAKSVSSRTVRFFFSSPAGETALPPDEELISRIAQAARTRPPVFSREGISSKNRKLTDRGTTRLSFEKAEVMVAPLIRTLVWIRTSPAT